MLKGFEERYPGMEHISLSSPIGTPKATMLEQFQWVAEEVMPAFKPAAALNSHWPASLVRRKFFARLPFVLAQTHIVHSVMVPEAEDEANAEPEPIF